MKSKLGSTLVFSLLVGLPLSSAIAADKLSDEWKEATISTRYALNDVLDSYDIETEVINGVARISGTVSSDIEKDLAEQIAKNTNGVKSVDNQITVTENFQRASEKSSGVSQQLSDATTTARVKSRFLWSNGVPGLSVDVDTKDGIVSLTGNVETQAQKKLAEKLALDTRGVRKVNNQLVAKADARSKVGSIDLDKVENNAGEAIEGAGDTLTDTWVHAKVSASLSFARSLTVDNLNVDVKNGAVTLSGVTYTQADKELAAEIAKDVKGVKSVVNKIEVI